ncbi:MAG: hypothetical protein EOO77_03930 [Oxalobacteraceae bacterium]|nr:MAG: hypothetical protein EOO77_03930 [Oxalobacteraceae bacterium]
MTDGKQTEVPVPTLGGGVGIVMQGMVDAADRARNEGVVTSRDPAGRLDHCPYGEHQDPVLRAVWQDAFAASKLYGDG